MQSEFPEWHTAWITTQKEIEECSKELHEIQQSSADKLTKATQVIENTEKLLEKGEKLQELAKEAGMDITCFEEVLACRRVQIEVYKRGVQRSKNREAMRSLLSHVTILESDLGKILENPDPSTQAKELLELLKNVIAFQEDVNKLAKESEGYADDVLQSIETSHLRIKQLKIGLRLAGILSETNEDTTNSIEETSQ